jgi:hypothetical protein
MDTIINKDCLGIIFYYKKLFDICELKNKLNQEFINNIKISHQKNFNETIIFNKITRKYVKYFSFKEFYYNHHHIYSFSNEVYIMTINDYDTDNKKIKSIIYSQFI